MFVSSMIGWFVRLLTSSLNIWFAWLQWCDQRCHGIVGAADRCLGINVKKTAV